MTETTLAAGIRSLGRFVSAVSRRHCTLTVNDSNFELSIGIILFVVIVGIIFASDLADSLRISLSGCHKVSGFSAVSITLDTRVYVGRGFGVGVANLVNRLGKTSNS